ncbi:MAG: gliding motility protein GldM, partial [Bacteroidota bacterium]|nr:gliding motility protein GldM [Bacteroidota bacterium]
MAGGKQSPRQKMINLMYLVFIAMLALNMSKEVLSAFGLINENLQSSNVALAETNKVALEELQRKSKENAKQYEAVAAQAQEVDAVTNEYYEYLESVKAGLIGSLGEGIAPNE